MVDLSLVDPRELWYIVGFITTDGNLSPDGRHISITSKDRPMLFKIRRALHLNNRIGRKASGSNSEKIYSVLQFGDVKFYQYLLKIGLMQRKSLILGKLKIPQKYFIDFLRGVIDGDGCIEHWIHRSNGNQQWSLRLISGSEIFLRWLKENVEKLFKTSGKFYVRKLPERNNLYILKFGKFPAKIILRGCYYDDCFALARKLQTAKKCLQSIDGLSKYGKFFST